jgi:hypothetical protein
MQHLGACDCWFAINYLVFFLQTLIDETDMYTWQKKTPGCNERGNNSTKYKGVSAIIILVSCRLLVNVKMSNLFSLKLVFAVSPLSTHYLGIRSKTGWLWTRIICEDGATCLPVDHCFIDLALYKNPTWCVGLTQSGHFFHL